MSRLKCDDLVLRKGKTPVMDRVSFEVADGTLCVVIGAPGSGKSTLARTLAGLESLDEGAIYLDDTPVHREPPKTRGIGLVVGDGALWPRRTVAENVGFGPKVRREPRDDRDRRVAEALSLTRVESLAHCLPGELTEIQRRRVALARALVLEPKALVLDDPLPRTIGDRQEYRDDLRRLQTEQSLTMVMTLDEPSDALFLADSLIVLELGRVVQKGSAQVVYNQPVQPYVARLLGEVNLLRGIVDSAEPRGEVAVRTPLGRLVGIAPSASLSTGQPVSVMIRPEALVVGANIPSWPNRLTMTIDQMVFEGPVRRLLLSTPDQPPLQSLALQTLSRGLKRGQQVTVSVASESIVVAPATGARIAEPSPSDESAESV